jgi:hypothetical protein
MVSSTSIFCLMKVPLEERRLWVVITLCFLALLSAALMLSALLDFLKDLSDTFFTSLPFVLSEEAKTFALVRYADARRLIVFRELETGRAGNGMLSRRCFPETAFTALSKAC